MEFRDFWQKVKYMDGVYADYLFSRDRLVPFQVKGYKLYKAVSYDWNGNVVGEAQWDGICFFLPEGVQETRYIFVNNAELFSREIEGFGDCGVSL